MFDITRRYPELMQLREFHGVGALMDAYRGGGKIFLCRALCTRPIWVSECTVRKAHKKNGEAVLVLRNGTSNDELLPIAHLVHGPVNAAFSDLGRASRYYELAVSLFASDPEWQDAYRTCLTAAVAREHARTAH